MKVRHIYIYVLCRYSCGGPVVMCNIVVRKRHVPAAVENRRCFTGLTQTHFVESFPISMLDSAVSKTDKIALQIS